MTAQQPPVTLEGLHALVVALTDKMAYVIENMATKDDIKDMATKHDIKDMATKEDIARLERRIKESSNINVQHHLAVRADIAYLNRKIDSMRTGLASAAKPVD